MNIKIKKLHQNAVIPQYATDGSAGLDLSVCIHEPVTLWSDESKLIGTGIAVEIPEGYCGLLMLRSGMSRIGLMLANGIGLIDCDYRGELMVNIWNRTESAIIINPFDRIAQMVIMPIILPTLKVGITEVEDLAPTKRGSGGFGSTGQ